MIFSMANVSKYQKMHNSFTMEPDQIAVGGDWKS
jgi:hypothetical protein